MAYTKFTDFKIRPLTLKEREICSNQAMEMRNFFTQVLIWIRYALTELKGVEITRDDPQNGITGNFDKEVNKLSDSELADISLAIREATQFPDKKKSSPLGSTSGMKSVVPGRGSNSPSPSGTNSPTGDETESLKSAKHEQNS